jgi:hypothetical protein
MQIVVNHLTRMQLGYICVAGVDVSSGQHIRPVLRSRLNVDLLARNGGPFDLGILPYDFQTNAGTAKDEVISQAISIVDILSTVDYRDRKGARDVRNREPRAYLIQSISSPRAEPFRLWLARVGEERFEEIEHPEAAIERVRATYRAKGYDDAWIDARIKNDLICNELTDEWKERGAKEGMEFAILTQAS